MSLSSHLRLASRRVSYADNLRVIGNCGSCRWEVCIRLFAFLSLHTRAQSQCCFVALQLKVDGKSCKRPIFGDVQSCSGINNHAPRLISGYCADVDAGTHTLTVCVPFRLCSSSPACSYSLMLRLRRSFSV